jgi:hypothetical protein
MFDKQKATTRIDGMISVAESIGVATVSHEVTDFPSDYEVLVW